MCILMFANEVDKLMYEYDCITMSAAIGPAAGPGR